MPRKKKDDEFSSWIVTKKLYVVKVTFIIDTLNKEINVIADNFLHAELIAKRYYPSATDCTTVRTIEPLIG